MSINNQLPVVKEQENTNALNSNCGNNLRGKQIIKYKITNS